MVSLRSILAAGCLSTIVHGAPLPTNVNELFVRAGKYIVYGGTGLLSEGWPAQSSWVSFESMWAANQGILTSGCGWSADQLPENSPSELSEMKSAITSVSSSSGVDSRFILAILLQESNGCVRVHSTDNGIANPGLMQSHQGSGTCNKGSAKQNPCPESEIVQMIKDGTEGTAAGDGLVGVLQKSGASDDSQFYKAARIYNSGSIAVSKNLGDGNGATACYASDIANRLMGFAGNTACDAAVSTLKSTVGFVPGSVADTPSSGNPGGVFVQKPSSTAAVPAPTPTQVAPVAVAPIPVAPTPVAEPVPVATATVIPVPVASPSTPEPSTPEPAPATPEPTSSPAAPSASGEQTAGSACPEEGTWNCITSTTFQQCASGIWSVSQSLAAGMQCKVGMSKVFSVSAVKA